MMANKANSKMSSHNRQRFMEANTTYQKLLALIALCQQRLKLGCPPGLSNGEPMLP